MSTSIAIQLLTLSATLLQRQAIHDQAAARTHIHREYDYIVVGAGTAGSIVATRLAQAGQKVLLFEAGTAATIMNDIPGAFPLSLGGKQDWGYYTEPQKNVGHMWASKKVSYLRGKVMGGSSTVNFMVYNRGNAKDYDNWAKNYGCGEQWSYRQLLPYFIKTERFANASDLPATSSYHGTKGEIGVSIPMHRDPIHIYYENAWTMKGVPITDWNGPQQVGIAYLQSTVDAFNKWIRSGTAQAYLYPNMHRKNFHILANTLVTKVLFRNKNIAYGVEFLRNGRRYGVKAKKEIVISAGAVNTPQLLMLSGIGPAKHLAEFNISIVADLPVGLSFQDHPLVREPFLVNNQSFIDWESQMFERVMNVSDLYAFWVDGTGPLTSRTRTELYYSSSGNPDKDWPDLSAAIFISQIRESMLARYQLTNNPTAWTNYYRPLVDDQRYFEILFQLWRISSRGTVRLQSTDPTVPPLIDPNFLADTQERAAMVEMMVKTYQTTEGEYFQQFATQYEPTIPGCESSLCNGTTLRSECPSYLECVIRMRGETTWHPVSTAPMGTHSMAVVEPDSLKVKNVLRLRVIDASVMPEVPNSNTNIPTVAIAEKGAEFVISDARRRWNVLPDISFPLPFFRDISSDSSSEEKNSSESKSESD